MRKRAVKLYYQFTITRKIQAANAEAMDYAPRQPYRANLYPPGSSTSECGGFFL